MIYTLYYTYLMIIFYQMKHAPLGSSSRHLFECLRLDEPWHGNVLLSCGPHKLEPKQQLQEFNADFVPWLLVPKR